MRPLIPMSHLTAAPNPERQFRLMEIVRRKLRERRYSRRTEEAYVHWIRRYIVFHDRRHPRDLGEAEVKAFFPRSRSSRGSPLRRRIRHWRRSRFSMIRCWSGR
jgi:hypothetical protein